MGGLLFPLLTNEKTLKMELIFLKKHGILNSFE